MIEAEVEDNIPPTKQLFVLLTILPFVSLIFSIYYIISKMFKKLYVHPKSVEMCCNVCHINEMFVALAQ